MNIIVTGGCGFIGSHLVDELVKLNHDVIVIDDLSANNEKFYFNDKAKYHKISICDMEQMRPLFKNIDYIFHLAAESRIQPSIEDPLKAVNVNVVGTTNILQLSLQNNIKRVIYSSTSAVYGLSCKFPTNESENIDCLNPYSATKFAGEEMARCFNKLHGLDVCIFRYFNVYGERSPVSGPYSLVVGIFLDQLKNNKNLTVVGDGENKRDFIHVKDIVDVNIAAMNHEGKLNSQVFNIGFGKNYKIIDIAKMISDKIEFIPARLGEAKTTLADIEKAKNILNWEPKIHISSWIKEKIV
jgi:UDP-glucose 4-epimerase